MLLLAPRRLEREQLRFGKCIYCQRCSRRLRCRLASSRPKKVCILVIQLLGFTRIDKQRGYLTPTPIATLNTPIRPPKTPMLRCFVQKAVSKIHKQAAAPLALRYPDPKIHYPPPFDPALCEQSHPRSSSTRAVSSCHWKRTRQWAKVKDV